MSPDDPVSLTVPVALFFGVLVLAVLMALSWPVPPIVHVMAALVGAQFLHVYLWDLLPAGVAAVLYGLVIHPRLFRRSPYGAEIARFAVALLVVAPPCALGIGLLVWR